MKLKSDWLKNKNLKKYKKFDEEIIKIFIWK